MKIVKILETAAKTNRWADFLPRKVIMGKVETRKCDKCGYHERGIPTLMKKCG